MIPAPMSHENLRRMLMCAAGFLPSFPFFFSLSPLPYPSILPLFPAVLLSSLPRVFLSSVSPTLARTPILITAMSVNRKRVQVS